MILHHKIEENQTILPINSVFLGANFLHLGDFFSSKHLKYNMKE
jgi:hypothetical protein